MPHGAMLLSLPASDLGTEPQSQCYGDWAGLEEEVLSLLFLPFAHLLEQHHRLVLRGVGCGYPSA